MLRLNSTERESSTMVHAVALSGPHRIGPLIVMETRGRLIISSSRVHRLYQRHQNYFGEHRARAFLQQVKLGSASIIYIPRQLILSASIFGMDRVRNIKS